MTGTRTVVSASRTRQSVQISVLLSLQLNVWKSVTHSGSDNWLKDQDFFPGTIL